MKKYTTHFLVITLITGLLGFTGLQFPGESFVRFVCLLSGIALMISCMDAVLLSRRQYRLRKKAEKIKINDQQ